MRLRFVVGMNLFPAQSEMLSRGSEMADVEQTQKKIPLITCEISLCQYVFELVFGVNIFDLDLGF